MSRKTFTDNQQGATNSLPPVTKNGNGEVVVKQPEIDDIYSPNFLTKEDASFLLEAERTSKSTSQGKVLPRRPPQ